jgi:hypothetical protein
MTESPIEKLMIHARRCDGFSFFYQNVAEDIGIICAEQSVALEFGNLKTFYDWARSQLPNHQADLCDEKIDTATAVIVHPEVIRLKEECETLRSMLEAALCDLQELVVTIIPNLKALYMIKIGSSELEPLKLRIETTKLKRTVELIQSHLNRGEKPDLVAIEAKLELELEEWQGKVNEQMKALREARSKIGHLMNDEETASFKALYRSLVRKLHPDINPGQTEKERNLWLKLQSAYERGDLEEMRLVEVLLGDCNQGDLLPFRSGIEEWKHMKSTLEEKLHHTREEITAVKREFPCSIREKINDDAWVEENNRKTRQEIQAEIVLKNSVEAQLENLRRMLPHEQ